MVQYTIVISLYFKFTFHYLVYLTIYQTEKLYFRFFSFQMCNFVVRCFSAKVQ